MLLWSCNWVATHVKLAFRKLFSLIVYPYYLITPWGMQVTWNANNQQYCRHLCFMCCLGYHLEFICSFVKPLYCFCFLRQCKTFYAGNSSITFDLRYWGLLVCLPSACFACHALSMLSYCIHWEKTMLTLQILSNYKAVKCNGYKTYLIVSCIKKITSVSMVGLFF